VELDGCHAGGRPRHGDAQIDNAQIPGIEESGPIGLQHHGGINKRTGEHGPASSLIQFRNLWIKRLERENAAARPAAPTGPAGFASLFNGKDLNGWLTGEFKVVEETNSGIFFRTSDLKDPVYTGLEIH